MDYLFGGIGGLILGFLLGRFLYQRVVAGQAESARAEADESSRRAATRRSRS